MRRGLIARSLIELPDAAFDSRLGRVRAAMRQAQLDALVIYTNNTQPSGVSWLVGFVPYWSEALLIVPLHGAPYLVAALSFRVKSWIERVSRVGEVLHTPRIGLRAAQQISAAGPDRAVGIVDFDYLPAGIADDFREGGPGLKLCDASELFGTLRTKADPAEIALTMKAGSIANRALGDVSIDADLNTMIAGIEAKARNLGAEEIYIAAAPDLDRDCRFRRIEGEVSRGKEFALRATVAYKGTWVRLVRAFTDTGIGQRALIALSNAVAQLPSEGGFSEFQSWLVEGCRTTRPLEPILGSRLRRAAPLAFGSLVSVQGVLALDGRKVPVAAPALIGAEGEAASLLYEFAFD